MGVGKVLQNLSNGKNFGGKEAYMGQLNDFIESNRTKMYALFDNLSSPPAAYEPSPFIVPQEYYETACCELYRHCERNCEKIIASSTIVATIRVSMPPSARPRS